MSKKAYEENDIQNIANAIREKNGTSNTYKVSDMATAIRNIEGGGGKYAPRYISFYQYTGTELNEELENLDTSNVTNMTDMFNSCRNLTSLDLSNFNTSNVTNMYGMFGSCRNLTSLDLSNFNTSNVTNMYGMFNSCNSLISLDLSNLDTSNVTSISNMFAYCGKLTNLMFCNNLGKGYKQKSSNYSNYTLDLSKSTNLQHDSLIDVINKIYDLNLTYDVANGGTLYTQKLILGSTNIAKLTAEEIAIATNKGWTVS